MNIVPLRPEGIYDDLFIVVKKIESVALRVSGYNEEGKPILAMISVVAGSIKHDSMYLPYGEAVNLYNYIKDEVLR